jgi:mRNA-degrading endonuclease RelE of RelBE toxin-antitoxin system
LKENYEIDYSKRTIKFLQKTSKTNKKLTKNILESIQDIKNHLHDNKKMGG